MPPGATSPPSPNDPAPPPALRLPVMPSGGQSPASRTEPGGSAVPDPNPPAAPGAALEDRIIDVLRRIRDPELPVNIYDLGLIYGLDVSPGGDVTIRMTLTTPACPVARSLPGQVEQRVRAVAGIGQVRVELVWDPPWTKDRLAPAARLQLGLL